MQAEGPLPELNEPYVYEVAVFVRVALLRGVVSVWVLCYKITL